MLKPDDLAWSELVAEIESVVSHRYVENPAALFDPFYMPSEEEPGFSFASLNRGDRMELLAELVSWRDYEGQGIGHAQKRIVIANVLDGKPQDKWLDGAFDEVVLENQKIARFKASVEDRENSPANHVFDDMDGDRLPWADLSAAAKLQYIALDAVRNDVPFEPFAEVVGTTIGEVGEAALRVVLDGQKELHAIAELLPDDGRTEPTPLVEQVEEMLEYVSALETQEKARSENREKLSEGVKGFQDTPREDRPMPEEVRSQEWGKRETERQAGVRKYRESMPEKWDAMYQLWKDQRQPGFISFLRAAAERPEMAGVPLGHLRAAHDVMMEGEWKAFRSSMSEFPTSCPQGATERMQEHDPFMQDPRGLQDALQEPKANRDAFRLPDADLGPGQGPESPEHEDEKWLTAEEQAELFKEIREDEAAAKLEDAHGTIEQRRNLRRIAEEKAKAPLRQIGDARGGPGQGPEQESPGGTLSLADLRADARDRSGLGDRTREHGKEQGKDRERGGGER